MVEIKLKPCPKCMGEPIVCEPEPELFRGWYGVKCKRCGYKKTIGGSKLNVILTWNGKYGLCYTGKHKYKE